MTAYRTAFIVVAMFLLSGCTPRGPKNPSEAAGEYVFPASSGEVAVVILTADSTYRQELYPDVASYRQSASPLHTNTATWSYNRSALTFNRWLAFFTFPNPEKRIEPPAPSISCPAYWAAPSGKRDAVILLSEEFHYAFLRVTNRTEGAKILDEVSRTKR